MQLYQYHELTPDGPLRAAFDKVTAALRAGDFRAADVKKMADTPYYRARLNDTDRLLFRFASYDGQTCLLLLELIRNHAYEKSKFLRGVAAAEPTTAPILLHPNQVPAVEMQPLAYVPAVPPAPKGALAPPLRFHLLDRPLFFDADQQAIFELPPPLIIIGSAGSGKTALTLEKLKTLTGTADAPTHVLYVTRSAYLVENAARLYAAHHAAAETQVVDFCSLRELVERIAIPAGQEIPYRRFAQWFGQHRPYVRVKDAERLFEEFHGVLTGFDPTKPYLALADYERLGARQSVFPPDERADVYALFLKYLDLLKTEHLFNPNIVAFERLALTEATYDFVVVDEVQDLTNTQLTLILRTLKKGPIAEGGGNFILCGDAHQVVHPNFFSWSGLKALFFQHEPDGAPAGRALQLLRTNYRNAPAVAALANRLLRIKNLRFGSLDRESTFLVEAAAQRPGEVVFLTDTPDAQRQLNARIRRSTQWAVVVLREEDKPAVRQYFDTPLLFSVHEAKGLEYENIVLVNCISQYERLFRDVAAGLAPADVAPDGAEVRYARPADRTDHHAEHYKFFVNALYVAVTRARRGLTVVERDDQHPLLPLLGLTAPHAQVEMATQTSTPDEWRREARKLDQQGRTEQAAAIREQVLEQQKPTWEPLTPAGLVALKAQAFDPDRYNRKAKDHLFAYGMAHDDLETLHQLRALEGTQKYNPARQRIRPIRQHLMKTKYLPYLTQDQAALAAYVARYGPEVRDTQGYTPLLAAAHNGALRLLNWLITDGGADRTATDLLGRTAWQHIMQHLARSPTGRIDHLPHCYGQLAPPTLQLRQLGHTLTFRIGQPEYFILNYLLVGQMIVIREKARARPATEPPAFLEVTDLETFFRAFPDSIIPAHRKTRRYLNALLARHTDSPRRAYYQSLWFRVRHGHYLLNPSLELEVSPGDWQSVMARLPAQLFHPEFVHSRIDGEIAGAYQKRFEELLAYYEAMQAQHPELGLADATPGTSSVPADSAPSAVAGNAQAT